MELTAPLTEPPAAPLMTPLAAIADAGLAALCGFDAAVAGSVAVAAAEAAEAAEAELSSNLISTCDDVLIGRLEPDDPKIPKLLEMLKSAVIASPEPYGPRSSASGPEQTLVATWHSCLGAVGLDLAPGEAAAPETFASLFSSGPEAAAKLYTAAKRFADTAEFKTRSLRALCAAASTASSARVWRAILAYVERDPQKHAELVDVTVLLRDPAPVSLFFFHTTCRPSLRLLTSVSASVKKGDLMAFAVSYAAATQKMAQGLAPGQRAYFTFTRRPAAPESPESPDSSESGQQHKRTRTEPPHRASMAPKKRKSAPWAVSTAGLERGGSWCCSTGSAAKWIPPKKNRSQFCKGGLFLK